MKKTLKIAATIVAAIMAAGFMSCSNDDAEDLGTLLIVKDYQEKQAAAAAEAAKKAAEEEAAKKAEEEEAAKEAEKKAEEESSETSVTLPDSVGDNELKSTSWKNTASSVTTTIAFSESTVTFTTEEGTETDTEEYKYTYNATDKLLYLELESVKYDGSDTISRSSDIETLLKNEGLSGDELSWEIEIIKNRLKTVTIYKYTLTDSSLKLENYFDGTLPPSGSFTASSDSPEYTLYSNSDGGIFTYEAEETSDGAKVNVGYRIGMMNLSDGSFDGNLYKQTFDASGETYTVTSLGTAKGTYTTSGKGTSDCTISFTFTSLPDGATSLSTGSAYKLTQEAIPTTYTKQ